ncbi:MAG: hypothetical protein PHH42_09740, partial [Bacteroidales bacterium]|nr:hypothetical protein [Bacteroidales bacterium]
MAVVLAVFFTTEDTKKARRTQRKNIDFFSVNSASPLLTLWFPLFNNRKPGKALPIRKNICGYCVCFLITKEINHRVHREGTKDAEENIDFFSVNSASPLLTLWFPLFNNRKPGKALPIRKNICGYCV